MELIKPVNPPLIVPDLVGEYNLPPIGKPETTPSYMDAFHDLLSKGGEGFPVTPASGVDLTGRYPLVYPGMDNEEMYAQSQSWGSKAVNAVGKGLVLTGTTFLQGTVGAVNGLVQFGKTGQASSFYNNDLNKWVDRVNSTLENDWANYYTQAERDANWYSPRKLFSANFFWDGIIKNMGFSVGTILSGAAWMGGLNLAARTLGLIPKASKLFAIGKAADTLAATEQALATGAAAGRGATLSGSIKSLSDKFLGQYDIMSQGSRALTAGLSVSGEAAFEAYHNMNEFRKEAIQRYRDENGGLYPTGEEIDKINQNAESVGNWSYGLNAMLLATTSYIQLPKILGSSYKAEKGIINNVTREIGDIVEEAGQYAVAPGKGGKILSTLNKIRPYTFSASEAFEEGAQFVITKGTQDYYDKKYNDLPADFMESLTTGISETLGTNEGMENLLIGGLSGAIMMGPGKVKEAFARSADTREAVNQFNKSRLSNFTTETFDAVKRGTYIQQQREKTLIEGNIVDSKDLEADYIINYLTPRIKYGRYDLVKSEIEDYRKLASTEDGFEQLQKEGKALASDTREAFTNRLILFEQTAESFKSLYQSLNLRYAGRIDESGKPVYSDVVMDKMVYAATKIADYERRIPELSNKLKAAGINVDQIMLDIHQGNVESFNQAVDNIKALDLIDEKKAELGEALDDVAEMGLRRSKFIQEYQDIKDNPSKYDEKRTELPSEKEETVDTDEEGKPVKKPIVKIKTKIGERDIEIGTEYYLGTVINYDKEGHEVYSAPKFTVLGENEDGTIKIKDSQGKERDVSKDEFLSYKLGKVSAVEKIPNARFFMRNWNRIVEWNLGKGKTTKGRLRYDPDKNQLVFAYKQKKRKGGFFIKELPVNIESFEPKKGYTKGVFSFVGDLVKDDTFDIQEHKKIKLKPQEAKSYEINSREGRREIVSQLYEEVKERFEETKKLIDSKKNDITLLTQDINDLTEKIEKTKSPVRETKTKGLRFKPTVRKLIESVNRLSRAKEDLQNEIVEAELENERLEGIISYLQDAVENVRELPLDTKETLYELGFQVELLQDTIDSTQKQIGIIGSLISKIETTLDTAVNFLADLISQFKTLYPKVPARIGQEWIDFLKANPNFLKKKPSYPDDIRELESIVAQIEDVDIIPNEEKLGGLKEQYEELNKTLEESYTELEAKKMILDRFQKIYDDYHSVKVEQERLRKQEATIKEALKTEDKSGVSVRRNDKGVAYEPDAKKSIDYVWRSTIGMFKSITSNIDHHRRANTFGFNLNRMENRKNIRGIYITRDNENLLIPGLTDFLYQNRQAEFDVNEVIALVMVDMTSGSPVLIDENGNPLTEEQLNDSPNHAIFQVFPMGELSWSAEYGEKSMFRKDTPEEVVESVRKEYKKFRKEVKETNEHNAKLGDDVPLVSKLSIHEIDASFGFPAHNHLLDNDTKEPVRDKNDKELIDYSTQTSVEDAGLVTSDDMQDGLIKIPTVENTVGKGTTQYNDASRRTFLDLPNGLVPLQNRKHTRKEADVIHRALIRLASNMIDPSIGIKAEESKMIIEWLKSVVYWGIPKTPEGKRKPDIHNGMYWEKDENNNFVLRISNNEQTFPFTPRSIEENRDEIMRLLQEDMYINPNAKFVKETGEPYTEITSISDGGEISTRTWLNYQAFLISKNHISDQGEVTGPRQDIPLTTTIVPISDTNPVNRTAIYFYTTDTSIEIDTPKPKIRITPIKVPTEAGKKEVVTPNGKKIVYSLPENVSPGDKVNINDLIIYPEGDLKEVLKATRDAAKKQYPDKSDTELDVEVKRAMKVRLAKLIGITIEEDTTVEDDGDTYTVPDVPNTKSNAPAVSDKDVPNDIKDKFDDADDDDSFTVGETAQRAVVGESIDTFEKEDWPKIEKWLKNNFPNVPVYRVKNLIQATNGKQAWGMFKDGAIYVYENAEVGTIYHEVFEAVWKMFTPQSEQVSIIDEFKQRKGTFTDRPTGKTINYSEATPEQIKEQLAEEFRDYVHFKKIPPKPVKGRPFILKLFSDLVNIIKSFFYGPQAQSKVEEMFKNISTGKYNNIVPYENQLAYINKGVVDIDQAFASEGDELRIKVIGDTQRNEVIQGMLYYTIADLIEKDDTLFNIKDSISKEKLYDTLQEKIIDNVVKKYRTDSKNVSPEQKADMKNKAMLLATQVKNDWDIITNRFEEYLKGFQIEFDENDNIALMADEKGKDETYVSPEKIDHFRKANTAIKLLISSISIVDSNGYIQRSSIGSPKILPASQVYITLMKHLHNSTSMEDMLYKLQQLAVNDANYRALYKRLTKRDYSIEIFKDGSNNYSVDLSHVIKDHSSMLLTSFWKTFKKQNADVKTLTIFEDGTVAVGDTSYSTLAAQMKDSYMNDIVIQAKKGSKYLIYDKKNKSFVGDPEKLAKVNLTDINSMFDFLKNLGINFEKSDVTKMSISQRSMFTEAVNGILKSLKEGKGIVNFSGKVLSIHGRLLELGYVQSMIRNPELDSTFFNVMGERTQSYIGTNPASDLYDFIGQVDELTGQSTNNTHFSYLINDSFSKGSIVLRKLFNRSNKKIQSSKTENLLKVAYVSGTDNQSRGRKKQSSRLTYRERLVQELNMNLAGYYMNLVPGDASMEWAIFMDNHVSEKNIKGDPSIMRNIFKGYFLSELEVSRESDIRMVAEGRDSKDMRFFKAILGDDLHNSIITTEGTVEEVYEKFEGRINSALDKFIKQKRDSLRSVLTTYNILQSTDEGFRFENMAIDEGLAENEVNTKLDFLNVNFMIANIELHKLLYSDPYLYSDELKRIKNFNSPRQAIINNSPKMNHVLNRVWNRNHPKGTEGWTNFERDYFNTAVFYDVRGIMNDVALEGYNEENKKAYKKPYDETDGGGIISFKAYRNLRIRSGEWSDKEESQYTFDMKYEELVKSGATKAELIEFMKSNPKVRSAYTPIKPIASGPNRNNEYYNDILLDKFALYPISLRLLNSINDAGGKENSNAIKMYNKMKNSDLDYVVFKTSRKVGASSLQQLYNENGTFNEIGVQKSDVTQVPFSIFSIQAEVPSKEDGSVTRGTQSTKEITMDFMEAGVPIDFELDEKGRRFLSFEEKYKAWYNLPEEQKKIKSPLYKEIKRNQEVLEAMIEVGYRRLLTQLGIREERKGEQYSYRIIDLSEAGKVLREEVLKREVNDNISMALQAFLDGKAVLEATPAYQQIRNILYSIADREVISQKISGSMKVQIPVSLLESVKAEEIEINGKKGFVSDTLRFYRNKDGERTMEIMIPRWFKSNMSDVDLLNYLNNTEEGKKILSGMAFRIPTQKQNSIDSFVVKQFLPTEFGDSVVVPSAIVVKAGSDFDIDKLTIYLKNVFVGKDGVPNLISLKTDENSTVNERYADWVIENTNKDIQKYVRFLSRDIVKEIKERHKSEFARLNEKYKALVKEAKDVAYGKLLYSYETIEEQLTDQDMYIQELFDIGKEIFRRLPSRLKEEFFMLRDYLQENNINGPEEIVQYLRMAEDMIENEQLSNEESSILSDLISNYTIEIDALGGAKGFIKNSKSEAVINFRRDKSNGIEIIKEDTSAERTEIKAKRKADIQTFYYSDEYINELARIAQLMSLEQFSQLNMLEQNTKKALENEYIESSQNLISHELNFDRLTKPNSADQLKGLSKEIAELRGDKSFDYRDVGNMLDRGYMSSLRHAFISGKYAIGIAAVNQTNHSLNQRQLVYIDPSRKDIIEEEDRVWLGDMKIKFDTFNKIRLADGREVATLSFVKNKEGQDISDINSQFIDGYVDISKDPWIIKLGATPNVTSTWLFLAKIGVPIDTIAYFMNQPIVVQYLRNIENDGYSWLFMSDYVDELKLEYASASTEPVRIPSKSALKASISKNLGNMSAQEKADQRLILDEFLKYAKMAQHLFYVTQGTNFDTATFNDPYLVFKKFKQLEKARNTIIAGVDEMLENSFIGKLGGNVMRVRNSLATILKSDHPRIRGILQDVLTPYVDLKDDEFLKIAQKAVSDLIDFAVQQHKGLNNELRNILIDKGGVATEVVNFMEEIRNNPNHPLYNNHIIGHEGILKPQLSMKAENTSSNNLRIRGATNKLFDQNNIIYAFREIRDYLKDKSPLYKRLVNLAILQSGLSQSYLSFTSVLPYEDFEAEYHDTLNKLESLPGLEAFRDMGIFQRNNWNNDEIVPRTRARYVMTKDGWRYNPSMEFIKPTSVKADVQKGVIPPVITVRKGSNDAKYEYIVYTWEKMDDLLPSNWRALYPKMTSKEAVKAIKKEMRDKGDYSFINKGLFKKVRDSIDNKPLETKSPKMDFVVYKAVNAWGEGPRANEFYTNEVSSKIDNGFIKVKGVSDNFVISRFTGELQPLQETDKSQEDWQKDDNNCAIPF
jgi:hypothetical protein